MEDNSEDIRFTLEPIGSPVDAGQLWRRLEATGCHSFFVSWAWIGTWLRCLPTHIRPHLLVAQREGEAMAAAVLVAREERRCGFLRVRQLHFNSTGDTALDCICIEHNGFVGATHQQPLLWTAFLHWFSNQEYADEIVISSAVQEVAEQIPQGDSTLHSDNRVKGYEARLQFGGMDHILMGLSRNTRQHLRRNLRDLRELGELKIEIPLSTEIALAWFGEMKSLHIRSWAARNRRHAFHHSFWEKFHRALIRDEFGKGFVCLRRVSAGSSVLGYLYDFRCGDRVYAYQGGFDNAFTRFRPGYAAHLLAMEQVAAAGARAYDFLAGDNQLKRSFGGATYRPCTHRFGKPTWVLRAEAAAKSALRSVRA